MIITISGPPGSGKSTLSRILSVRLGMEHISMGDVFRKCAEDRCMCLAEFGILAKSNGDIDREIDEMQRRIAKEKDNIIIEGRLSGFLVDADMKVWLKAPIEIRAERIAKREGKHVLTAMAETSEREQCERERYLNYYNIDIKDMSVYDLVIDSSKWGPEGISDIVVKAIEYLV
ncbi:putative cytidylate kinase [Candidatus Methanoperedens nitroreducens]|uniref:Cytidylate kinase n=1 Tax=Candidatus Methanoperedens nitratireducens TaxID=1392998 RepID=A0A062V185_9EURY|nr:AAA family ATPase [Candidatus Methanoperedens nitroreducens]KCZ72876.1 putative cytidylate kinase [Candidatus Methanoperedens nitroreducens]MDJ1423196.1 AAA family ATPase [Candidatus Methanoperedens sp.]